MILDSLNKLAKSSTLIIALLITLVGIFMVSEMNTITSYAQVADDTRTFDRDDCTDTDNGTFCTLDQEAGDEYYMDCRALSARADSDISCSKRTVSTAARDEFLATSSEEANEIRPDSNSSGQYTSAPANCDRDGDGNILWCEVENEGQTFFLYGCVENNATRSNDERVQCNSFKEDQPPTTAEREAAVEQREDANEERQLRFNIPNPDENCTENSGRGTIQSCTFENEQGQVWTYRQCVRRNDAVFCDSAEGEGENPLEGEREPLPEPEEDGGIGKILLDLFAKIILIILWIFSYLVQVVLWLLMVIFGAILQINPAGQDFIGVAIEPWRIVVSIANLITLFSFLYTGFRYILGVKQKTPIGDFLVNVIVVVLTINFTIFAAAAVVNISQGIGDTFVGAYSSVADPGKRYGEVLFDNFVSGVSEVSYIRCGNVDKELGIQSGECRNDNGQIVANLGAILFTDSLGSAQAAMVGELAYILILGYAIVVIWQALFIALIRVVGLWLLMVTSPFALAAFFSPVPQLKKLAEKWVQYFLNFTMLYPVMVLGLVLIGAITQAFGQAARENISGGFVTSGTTAEAAGELVAFDEMLPLLLLALVAIGSLNLLVAFLKTFKSITDGIYNTAKAFGKKVAQGGALGARLAGAGLSGISQGQLNSNQKEIAKLKSLQNQRQKEIDEAKKTMTGKARDNAIKDINAKYDTMAGAGGRFGRGDPSLDKRLARYEKMKGKLERDVQFGKNVKFLPERLKGWKDFPKTQYDNFMRGEQAERDGQKAIYDFRRELAWRAAGGSSLADLDPNTMLPGVDREQAQKLMSDDEESIKEREKLENRFYAEATRSKLDIKRKLSKNQVKSGLDQLSAKSKGSFYDLDDKGQNQFLEYLQQGMKNPEIQRQIATDSNLTNMVRDIVDQGLVDDDTQKLLNQNTNFIPDEERRRKRAYDISDDEFIRMQPYEFSPETLQELYERFSRETSPEEALQKIRGKVNIKGGLTDTGLAIAQSQMRDKLKALDPVQESIVKSAQQNVIQKGLDETSFIQAAAIAARENGGEIREEDFNRLMGNTITNAFGAASIEELQSTLSTMTQEQKIKYLEDNSLVGKSVASNSSYGDLTPEKKLQAQLTAAEMAINNHKITQQAYDKTMRDAIKVQYKAAEKFRSATDMSIPAQKDATRAVRKVQQGNRSEVTQTDFEGSAAYEVVSEFQKEINNGIFNIEDGPSGRLDITQLGQKGVDDLNKLMKQVIKSNMDGDSDAVERGLDAIRDRFDGASVAHETIRSTLANDATIDSIINKIYREANQTASAIRNASDDAMALSIAQEAESKLRKVNNEIRKDAKSKLPDIGKIDNVMDAFIAGETTPAAA